MSCALGQWPKAATLGFSRGQLALRDRDPHEVWVEQHEREELEQLIREACPSPAARFLILQVAFESATEHRAFTQVYTDLTNIPHGLCGGGDPGGIDTMAVVQAL